MQPIFYREQIDMAHHLALIGFGSVGQGLAQIVRDKGDSLRQSLGLDLKIVAVCTATKGSLYHPDGLDVAKLLEVIAATGHLAAYPDSPGLAAGWDSLTTIRQSKADTIVETTPTNLTTGQPAIDYCRAAFESGKNVVTANKGPAALAYHELSALAREKGVYFGIEGTVMSGTPSLRLAMNALAGNQISQIRGILNGTTNYILTQMENELNYEVALKQAQELGYAETDPTADVEGHDAAGKVVILANVVMHTPLTLAQVACQGISRLTLADMAQARAEGKRWKLIGRITQAGDRVTASVGPEMLPLFDPLANVMGAVNAVTYQTDLMGPITLIGAGAGRVQTGFALLSDIIDTHKGSKVAGSR
jgi:homoserine dehydrogenase